MDTDDIIRNYFKTLTDEDIANSTFLYGIDFDNDPLDKIFKAVSQLYDNVTELNSMIARNFTSKHDVKMPKDFNTQSIIIQDYHCKSSALRKILSNKTVYAAFVAYSETNKDKRASRR